MIHERDFNIVESKILGEMLEHGERKAVPLDVTFRAADSYQSFMRAADELERATAETIEQARKDPAGARAIRSELSTIALECRNFDEGIADAMVHVAKIAPSSIPAMSGLRERMKRLGSHLATIASQARS